MKKKFENKIIAKLIFLYFNIRNIKISKYRSFYISSFQILTPALHYATREESNWFSPRVKLHEVKSTSV